MMSQPGKQIIPINTVPNISESNGSQTITFGQLIEYNTRNLFLEKPYTKCGGDAIPRPFSKKSRRAVFIVCQVEGYQNILKQSSRPFAITSYKAFLKNKKEACS